MRKEKWTDLRAQLVEFRAGLQEEQKFHSRLTKVLGALGEMVK